MIQIYNIAEKPNSPGHLHKEVCRNCAKEFQEKGLAVEIDFHLSKHVYEKDGYSYYTDGTDEGTIEIDCSICGCPLATPERLFLEENE